MTDREVTRPPREDVPGSTPPPTDRRMLPIRTTLVTVAVGCLVLLYLLWWTTYAGIHFDQRYRQLAPGEAGRTGDTTVRVVSMTTSRVLADQKYDTSPEPAAPGTVWVVTVLEASRPPGATADFYCTTELLGPDGRRWEKESAFSRTLPSCTTDLVVPGPPVRFETVFQVPERFVGEIVGVALLDPVVPDRVEVISPPG